jgi:hypothetical protein
MSSANDREYHSDTDDDRAPEWTTDVFGICAIIEKKRYRADRRRVEGDVVLPRG